MEAQARSLAAQIWRPFELHSQDLHAKSREWCILKARYTERKNVGGRDGGQSEETHPRRPEEEKGRQREELSDFFSHRVLRPVERTLERHSGKLLLGGLGG